MIDVDAAATMARAWVGSTSPRQTGWSLCTYDGFGPPEDYFVFSVPDGSPHVWASHHIAVHKRTGKVHDLSNRGE